MKIFVGAAMVTSLLLIAHSGSYAQPADILRLREIIREKQAKPDFATDTAYIDALDSLAFGYYRISPDSVFLYSRKALDYSKKAGYGKGESNSLRIIGNGYRLIGDYVQMISYYHEALVFAEKIDDPLSIAKAATNLGMFYIDIGKDEEARVLNEKACRIFEKTGDSLNLNKALTNIGAVLATQKKNDSALMYYQRALVIALAMKNQYLIVTNNSFIGLRLIEGGRYKEALDKILPAQDYFSHTDDKMRKSSTATMLAEAYFMLKDYPTALRYGQQGLELGMVLKSKSNMADAYELLEKIYEARGDYLAALRYSKLYKAYSDSLFNENSRKATDELEARYEYQEKEKLLKEEQARKDSQHRELVRKKQLEIYIGALLILFLSLLIFVLFWSRAIKQRNYVLLESKNEEINVQKEEMENLAIQLMLNNQQKDMLFGIIAHDLQTPLYSLKELMNLLKKSNLSEVNVKTILEELNQDVDYSAELINNLLFWARSQLGGLVASPVELPLRQLAEDTVGNFLKQAAAKNIGLNNKIDPALSGYADKNMIVLLIRNLLSNAVKFCRAGDTITLQATKSGSTIEICVADTGIGITKEVLNKILQKKSTTSFGTEGEKGTGLGLLLCQEFAEMNSGRFRVESIVEEGSRFCFTLPAAS